MIKFKKQHKHYSNYKDSGIEWLGKVPENWKMIPLKHILNLKKDVVGNNSSKYKILSLTLKGVIPRDMDNNFGKFPAEFNTYQIVRKDDLLFCLFDYDVTPRTIGLVQEEGLVTGAYTAFSKTNKTDSRFYYYYYLNLDISKELLHLCTGLRHSLSKDMFFALKNVFPSLSEQTSIANYLDEKTTLINSIIEKKQRQIKLLEERRSTLINKIVTKGLDAHTEKINSGVEYIGEIPKDWKVNKLKFFTSKIVDGTHFTPKYTDFGVPFLRVTDIHSNEIDLNTVKFISEAEHRELTKRCKPEKNDILLSKNGTIGIPKVIDWDWEFSIFVSLCLIKMNKKIIYSHYAKYFFESEALKKQITHTLVLPSSF